MSNSRVESHSRAELRNRIISTATLLEILLSGLVLIGLLLSMVPLLSWTTTRSLCIRTSWKTSR